MVERIYAGMSAEERSNRRHEQFLAAGLAVFADRGWTESTVADVCRAAALSRAISWAPRRPSPEARVEIRARAAPAGSARR